jgi:hypothetical protein
MGGLSGFLTFFGEFMPITSADFLTAALREAFRDLRRASR